MSRVFLQTKIAQRDGCPYRKLKTADRERESADTRSDERSLQVDLVRLDRTVPVAGYVGSRDPCPSTPTQRAAAQIPEAIGVRQYGPAGPRNSSLRRRCSSGKFVGWG